MINTTEKSCTNYHNEVNSVNTKMRKVLMGKKGVSKKNVIEL